MMHQSKPIMPRMQTPEQMAFLLANQANELRQLRDKLAVAVDNYSTCQLLLAYAVRDNPITIDLTQVQSDMLTKQLNFEHMPDGKVKIYLTDKLNVDHNPNSDDLPAADSIQSSQE